MDVSHKAVFPCRRLAGKSSNLLPWLLTGTPSKHQITFSFKITIWKMHFLQVPSSYINSLPLMAYCIILCHRITWKRVGFVFGRGWHKIYCRDLNSLYCKYGVKDAFHCVPRRCLWLKWNISEKCWPDFNEDMVTICSLGSTVAFAKIHPFALLWELNTDF